MQKETAALIVCQFILTASAFGAGALDQQRGDANGLRADIATLVAANTEQSLLKAEILAERGIKAGRLRHAGISGITGQR